MARQATMTVQAVTIAASLLAHAAAAVVARTYHGSPSRTTRAEMELPVELLQSPLAMEALPPPEESAPDPAQIRTTAHPTHTHPYPVAPDHDAHAHSAE